MGYVIPLQTSAADQFPFAYFLPKLPPIIPILQYHLIGANPKNTQKNPPNLENAKLARPEYCKEDR
jgi:hypothetical protein